MGWYLYIVRCEDGSLYAGVTTNPDERVKRHNAGRGSIYVRSKGGASLVYVEQHATKGLALRREYEIKSWRREKKLALIARRIPRSTTQT